MPVAAAVCFGAGFLLGLPALRLHGLYLALVTLGLAVATPQLIKRFDGLTGGTQGSTWTSPPRRPGAGPRRRPVPVPGHLAIAWSCSCSPPGMVRGRVGRALLAVRDNEIAART